MIGVLIVSDGYHIYKSVCKKNPKKPRNILNMGEMCMFQINHLKILVQPLMHLETALVLKYNHSSAF